MGFWGAWESLKEGSVTGAFNRAFLDDDNIADGQSAEVANQQLNQERLARGFYTPEQYAETQAHLQGNSSLSRQIDDPETSAIGGFQESIKESVSAAGEAIQGASTWGVMSILKLIPWPVYAALAGYLAFVTAGAWLPALKRMGKK